MHTVLFQQQVAQWIFCVEKGRLIFHSDPISLSFALPPLFLATHTVHVIGCYSQTQLVDDRNSFAVSLFVAIMHLVLQSKFISEYMYSTLCDQPPEQTHFVCQKLISGHICPIALKTAVAVLGWQKAQLLFGWSSLMGLKYTSSSRLKSKQTIKQTDRYSELTSPIKTNKAKC